MSPWGDMKPIHSHPRVTWIGLKSPQGDINRLLVTPGWLQAISGRQWPNALRQQNTLMGIFAFKVSVQTIAACAFGLLLPPWTCFVEFLFFSNKIIENTETRTNSWRFNIMFFNVMTSEKLIFVWLRWYWWVSLTIWSVSGTMVPLWSSGATWFMWVWFYPGNWLK